MDEIDFSNDEKRNNFNFFTFTLNLTFFLDNMNVQEYSFFTHEYTHYLQSIGTINGISVLMKYFTFMKDIYADINNKICNDIDYDTTYLSEYSDKYAQIKELYKHSLDKPNLNKWPDYFLSHDKYEHPIYKKEFNEYFITIGENDYHISQKCLRETMAMMTFFHARNYTLEEAIDYLKKDSVEPVYKILFLYFANNYPYIDDLIFFTYRFTELALQTDEPNEILDKLIKTIKYTPKNSRIYTKTFFEKFDRENPKFKKRLPVLKDKLERDISSLQLLEKNNEYFTAVRSFLNRTVIALKEYINNNYTYFDNFASFDSIKTFSKKILSPIIIQDNQKTIKVSTLDDQTDKYEMALLFGVSQLLDRYIDKDTSPMNNRCLFYTKIPVCKYSEEEATNQSICENKPFDIKPFKNGNCIFYNSSLVLGMLPDEEIQKYKEKIKK